MVKSSFIRSLLCGGLLALVALPGCKTAPQVQVASSLSILPLKTLRLYETGVGYFERAGVVRPDDTALPLPAGHLDDALKTLVVYSQDKNAHIYGMTFPSSVSRGMGRALAGLPQSEDDAVSYKDLLNSLKGAAIAVKLRSGETHAGRLIEVVEASAAEKDCVEPAAASAEKGKESKPTCSLPSLTLLILGEGGELIRLATGSVSSVRPKDPAYAGRLGTALDAVSQRGSQSQRFVRLLSKESGPITLGYLAETPLWRVTYRLVLAENRAPAALQGWSLVHNDTDEDWRSVRLQLVSGRPDSYLFPLAAPRYTRRELVTPENQLSTVPQLLGNTADRMWGDHLDDAQGVGGLSLSGTGSGGGGTGEGSIGLGSISTVGHGMGASNDSPSSLLQVGNLAAVAQATGVESGALFLYSLSEAIDLPARSSALLPFVSEQIEAEQITTLSGPHATPRAAVRLINSSKQTLPAGPIAIYSDGGLAGESALDRMKAGERRMLEYGTDLDLALTVVKRQAKSEPQRLAFDSDVLETHALSREDVLYRIENRSSNPKTVYFNLQVGSNARVQGADRVDFDTENKHAVAVFEVPAQSRIEKSVSTQEGRQHRSGILGLSTAQLQDLASATTLPAGERAILQEAILRARELDASKQEITQATEDLKKAELEIARLREHLKAMGHETAAGAAQNPVLKRLLDAEDRLTLLQKKKESAGPDQDRRREALRKVLERLPKKPEKPIVL